ncbi:hypothetical protein ABVT39_006727 [Epinephelus coioides]
MRASYDNLLPGITPKCLAVWAGFTMLSPRMSLKRRADIQLDMSTIQAKTQTCVSEGEKDDGSVDFKVGAVRTRENVEYVTEQRRLPEQREKVKEEALGN